jgi:hypothetical protein
VDLHSSNKTEKNGVMKFIRNVIYRFFLYNGYDDEYQGYEEQGISFEEWKAEQTLEKLYEQTPGNTLKKHPSDYIQPEEDQTNLAE